MGFIHARCSKTDKHVAGFVLKAHSQVSQITNNSSLRLMLPKNAGHTKHLFPFAAAFLSTPCSTLLSEGTYQIEQICVLFLRETIVLQASAHSSFVLFRPFITSLCNVRCFR